MISLILITTLVIWSKCTIYVHSTWLLLLTHLLISSRVYWRLHHLLLVTIVLALVSTIGLTWLLWISPGVSGRITRWLAHHESILGDILHHVHDGSAQGSSWPHGHFTSSSESTVATFKSWFTVVEARDVFHHCLCYQNGGTTTKHYLNRCFRLQNASCLSWSSFLRRTLTALVPCGSLRFFTLELDIHSLQNVIDSWSLLHHRFQ